MTGINDEMAMEGEGVGGQVAIVGRARPGGVAGRGGSVSDSSRVDTEVDIWQRFARSLVKEKTCLRGEGGGRQVDIGGGSGMVGPSAGRPTHGSAWALQVVPPLPLDPCLLPTVFCILPLSPVSCPLSPHFPLLSPAHAISYIVRPSGSFTQG